MLPEEVKGVKGNVQVGSVFYLLAPDPLVRTLDVLDEEEVNIGKQDHRHLIGLEILERASPAPEAVPDPVVGHMVPTIVGENGYRDVPTTDKLVA